MSETLVFDYIEHTIPVVNAAHDGVTLTDWVNTYGPTLRKMKETYGGVLIRKARIHSPRVLASVLQNIWQAELQPYQYRSTPRTELQSYIYTATEYNADSVIEQHNENSYSNVYPMDIGFFCMVPPLEGGQTPIVDSQLLYERLPSQIKDKFEAKGVTYIRYYGDIDLPWSEVFCTNDKAQVEKYCETNLIECTWLDGNILRTKQTLPAVQTHPITGKKVWFNQSHLFHPSALGAPVREAILNNYGETRLPRNVTFGDGTRIETDYLDTIRQLLRQLQLSYNWQRNDLLLLDNMRFSHGRNPFKSKRKILVGMANPARMNMKMDETQYG